MDQRTSFLIIGAGISGLVAAIELEKAGYAPTIIDQLDRVGGRVQSDIIDGVPYDHGFQVLLTKYPEAQRYLNYDHLDLIRFQPGSLIFDQGKQRKIGDPLRDISFLLPTALAPVGSIADKLRILKLSQLVKSKSLEDIFAAPETTTMTYLKNYGFSSEVIRQFFQPFFAGIYLESDLNTSSRMFEFVYKMFSEGYAAVPRKGMQAIPDQLKAQLKQTQFRFNTSVAKVNTGMVTLKDGTTIKADKIIVATDSASMLDTTSDKSTKWKSCHNLYFKTKQTTIKKPLIGLVPAKGTLINNLHFVDAIYPKQTKGSSIVSVTVVAHTPLALPDLTKQIQQELKTHCHIEATELIKAYSIKKALPKLNNLKYMPDREQVITSVEKVYTCGDYLANGSLNAAMASGRRVVEVALG